MRKRLIHTQSRCGKYATDNPAAYPARLLIVLNRAGGVEGWLPAPKPAGRRKRGLGFASRIVGPGLAGQAAFWAGEVGLAVARQAPEITFGVGRVEVKGVVVVLRLGARRFTGREGCHLS